MKQLPVYFFNTDPYPKIANKNFKFGKVDNVDTVFTLASGFKRYKYSILYQPKKLVVYDLNPYAVALHRRIDDLEKINFEAICELYYEYEKEKINAVLSDYKLPNLITLSVEKQLKLNWDIECQRWGGEENFVTAFLYFKQQKRIYETLDVIQGRDDIKKHLGKTNFIHISNIFSWTHNPKFDRIALQKEKEEFGEFCWKNKIGVAND
tara:strand:- start:26 stop:649 length:624 start_codon:yes stop_codon:yes gene_type:complete